MTNQQNPISMTDSHSITPPPELVHQWETTAYDDRSIPYAHHIARCAAQWGWWRREPEIQAAADQELEACCKWLMYEKDRQGLRAARRPKPPSLKERALSEVAAAVAGGNITPERGAAIRIALEQLDD